MKVELLKPKYRLVDQKLTELLKDPEERKNWLVLDEHPDFKGRWIVESFAPSWFFDLREIVGPYRAVSPANLQKFLSACEEFEYSVAFFEEPFQILEKYESLNVEPEIELASSMEGTVKGMLPFQVQGYNFLKDLDGGVAMWSTGTGKTVLASALLKYHRQKDSFDLAFYVAKAHNKVNVQRTLKRLADIPSLVVDGSKKKREDLWREVAEAPRGSVVVTNYEKFRHDKDQIKFLVEGRDCIFIWDEMPTKLKTRNTQLYGGVCESLYKTPCPAVDWERRRPNTLRQWMLSATPIENDPEDFFNCLTGDTEVEPIGDITRTYRGYWKGPLVKLVTASGTKLTIGPNHPVLTRQGWVNAQFLTKGDEVICRPIQGPLSIKNLNQKPTLIENLFNTSRATSKSIRMKRATPFEFHGDGKFFQGEVNIVDVDGSLSDVRQPNIRKKLSKSFFGFAHSDTESSLLSLSTTNLSVDGISSTKTRPGSLFHPPFRSVASTPTRPQIDARFSQPVGNQFLADTKLVSDTRSGTLILDIQAFNQSNINGDARSMSRAHLNASLVQASSHGGIGHAKESRNITNGFSLGVETDEVVSVEVIEWEGHIYDLSTSSGTYYANGIVTNNCVRLLDPRIYGTVAQFRDQYVQSYSFFSPTQPDKWHNLDKMGLVADHVMHQVDKTHPDIAEQFPSVIEEPYYIDWDSKDRRIYDLLAKQAVDLDLDETNVLSLITVMQMLCDAPSMVKNSAAVREAYEQALQAWLEEGGKEPLREGSEAAKKLLDALGEKNITDERHTKLDTLRELLCEVHPKEKVLIFSAFNEGLMPIMEAKLREWGVSYVRYTGSPKTKQAAQDKFMLDKDIQVFLSSDMGSDSLSLEQAGVVIHYDLPWKWSTLIQRQNRVHRIDSEFDRVRFYTLMMANSVEDRKLEIIQRKQGYHEQVFKGATDQAASAGMTKEDLRYILLGEI